MGAQQVTGMMGATVLHEVDEEDDEGIDDDEEGGMDGGDGMEGSGILEGR